MSSHTSSARLIIPVVLSLSTVGCDGSNDSGGNGNSSGPQSGLESRTLSTLTQTEVDNLNEALDTYAATAVPVAYNCKVAGLSEAVQAKMLGYGDADLRTACSNAQASCIKDNEPNSRSPTAMSKFKSCQATVAEFEVCVKDDYVAMMAVVDYMPDCSEIESATLLSYTSTTPETPTSCAVFDDKCPGII